jgi:tetratricopeptide (TPR) repeat protein
MIVKNESQIIDRCLASVKPFVDYIVITDTGSTDDTVQIIETFLAKENIAGKVFRSEWRNFGANRTESFENVQKWLDEQHIDRSTNYAVTIDADMCMCESAYDKTALSTSISWSLLQKSSALEYWNTRVIRSDLPAKCVGVTHEYWEIPNIPPPRQFAGVYLSDFGDGGCKHDKFTRDIRLLTEGLLAEPTNTRYMFYLANSLKDVQQYADAVEMYKKRVSKGGWVEELFMSWLYMGICYEALNQSEHAVSCWLYAYNVLPRRAESLWRVARHYRLRGQNVLGLMFVREGLRLSKPKDLTLFIEPAVYEYALIEELSIMAFYTGAIQTGRVACQYLARCPFVNVPDSVQKQAQKNCLFYMRPLATKGGSIQQLTIHGVDKTYHTSSACLWPNGLGLQGVVRAVNYTLDREFTYHSNDEDGVIRTINYWCTFDADGSCTQSQQIEHFQPTNHLSIVQGLEDIRVCQFGDKMYAIAVSSEYGVYPHPSVVWFEIVDTCRIPCISPIRFREDMVQKNWTLFATLHTQSPELYICYSHHPFTLLRVTDLQSGVVELVCEHTPVMINLENVRGSANPVYIPKENAYLFLVHEVAFEGRMRKYFHRFLKYDAVTWNLIAVTEPFVMKELYVEFSLSVLYMDGPEEKLKIVFSTCDNSTEVLTVPYNQLSYLNWQAIPVPF